MHGKPLLLLTLFSLSLLAVATAADDPIFNKTYKAPGTITMDLGDYALNIGSGNVTTILLSTPNSTIILGEHDCKRFGHERLCYEEKTGENQVRLSLIDLQAQIETSLFFLDEHIRVGDTTTGVFDYNNTGLNTATRVSATLRLPANLTVTDIDDCKENGTHITWTGTLIEDETHRCLFTVRADGRFSDEEIAGNVTYTTYEATYSETTEETSLSAHLPFILNITTGNLTQLEPAEPFIISYSIEHNGSTDNLTIASIELDLNDEAIYLSSDAPRVAVSGGKVKTRVYRLDEGEGFTGSVELMVPTANASGELILEITYNYSKDDQSYTFERRLPYHTDLHPLYITASPANPSFESLSNGEINITVTNPYSYLTFKGYDTTITSELLKTDQSQRYPYQRSRTVGRLRFTAPAVQRETQYEVVATVVVRTNYYQSFIYEERFPVTIIPIREASITRTVQPLADGTIQIVVNITNHHQRSIQADISETLPEHYFVKGSTESSTTIKPGNHEAYNYTVLNTLPREELQDENIITTLNYAYLGTPITREETTTIPATLFGAPTTPTVTPPETENATQQEEKENVTTTLQPTEEEKVGFPYFLPVSIVLLFLLITFLTMHFFGKRPMRLIKKKHQSIQEQYNELMQESRKLRDHKKLVCDEQRRITDELRKINEHITTYEKQLPKEWEKLNGVRDHLGQAVAMFRKHREDLEVRLAAINKEEEALSKDEEQAKAVEERIKARETQLITDKEQLLQDAETLKKQKESIVSEHHKLVEQQKTLADRIQQFKTKHIHDHKQQLHDLSDKKKEAQAYHRKLEEQEAHLKEEFDRITQDLNISGQDIQEAEKVYKEAEEATIDARKDSTPTPDARDSAPSDR